MSFNCKRKRISKRFNFVFALVIIMSSANIYAARAPSQAMKISIEDAGKAVSLLKTRDKYIEFCLPCEKTLGTDVIIKKVEIKSVTKKKVTVFINGKPTDLAYVYINYRKFKNKNMAAILGIKTFDVPTSYDRSLESIYARRIQKMKQKVIREAQEELVKAEKWADIQKHKSVEILPDSPIK